MKKVFIMNGRGTSGKTTFETMVKKISEQSEKTVDIISTIDYVKDIARDIGWDGGKSPEDRRFLSDLKDALTKWKDLPHQVCCEKINDSTADAIFVDCREPEEIERFVKDFNALTVLVQRGPVVIFGNHADDNVGNYQYDVTIDNSRGLAELEEEARIFVETFIMEE